MFYVGFQDGGVQAVDVYNPTSSAEGMPTTHPLYSEQFRDVPITLPEERWTDGQDGGNTGL